MIQNGTIRKVLGEVLLSLVLLRSERSRSVFLLQPSHSVAVRMAIFIKSWCISHKNHGLHNCCAGREKWSESARIPWKVWSSYIFAIVFLQCLFVKGGILCLQNCS